VLTRGEGKWYFPSMATATTFLTLDKKGRTTLPEEVRQALGVGAGDFLLLERTARGTYELVPATLVPNEQLWFHAPEMQARIRRAEEEFASGQSTRTDTPAQAQGFLDSLKKAPQQRR
jgi:AbrB family looped-hinge helix DNA binding protein